MEGILQFLRCGLAVAAVFAALAFVAGAGADGGVPPPPGWDAEDWATLSAEEQEGVLQEYPYRGPTDAGTVVKDMDAYIEALAAEDGTLDNPIPTGVLNVGQCPFCRGVIWSRISGKSGARTASLIAVYARLSAEDETRGLLLVNVLPESDPSSFGTIETYSAPAGTGYLSITDEAGGVLSVVGENGWNGRFNVNTKELDQLRTVQR